VSVCTETEREKGGERKRERDGGEREIEAETEDSTVDDRNKVTSNKR